jgi:hypothetical protein
MKQKEIERKLAKLAALEAGGVDNWDFYDESLKEYRATIEREELAEKLVSDILDTLSEGIHEPAGRGCGFGFSESAADDVLAIIMEQVKEFYE